MWEPCVYNIPESQETEAKNAFQDDINKLQQTFSGKFKLDKKDVTYIRRIGKSSNNSNNDKTRPIIIQFKDNKKKIEALKLRNLKYIGANDNINIYISPDRTQKQQVIHKKLIEEVKQRKDNGEPNLYIYNGKIVNSNQAFNNFSRNFLNEAQF